MLYAVSFPGLINFLLPYPVPCFMTLKDNHFKWLWFLA